MGQLARRMLRHMMAGIVAMTAWGMATRPALAVPGVPASDDEVLERLAFASDPIERELRRVSAQLAVDRGNLALALDVARRNVARGQSLADPRHLGRAEAAIAPWTATPDPPNEVRVIRGILRQSAHRFDAALDDFDQVLRLDPRHGQARLSRAAVHLVRADYAAARDDCAQLAGTAAAPALDICVSAVAAMTGHARPALAMLRIAASRVEAPALKVWALTLRGEVAARLGEPDLALDAFEQARAVAPDDAYLLGACADTLLDAGRAADAEALLAGRTRADALLLRLIEAETRLGRPDPDHVRQLADRFETSRRRDETGHWREQARFALHVQGRGTEALRLARDNWRVQREPADARILLEAALAAGSPDEASPVLAWWRANKVEDVRLAPLVAQIEQVTP